MPCPYRVRVAPCGERRPRTVPRRDPPVIGHGRAGIQRCIVCSAQYVLVGQICLLICHWIQMGTAVARRVAGGTDRREISSTGLRVWVATESCPLRRPPSGGHVVLSTMFVRRQEPQKVLRQCFSLDFLPFAV